LSPFQAKLLEGLDLPDPPAIYAY